MKTTIFSLLLSLLALLFTTPISAQIIEGSEESALQTTLLDYLHGGTNGETERLISAFHESATLLLESETSGDFREVPLAKFFADELKKAGKPEKRISRIRNYKISGDAAHAKVEHIYRHRKVSEHVNLLKINGKWRIVQIVSNREEKELLADVHP